MKIGIYDPYLDDIGGGEKYMMSIAEFLSREHDVEVFWDEPEDMQKILSRFSLDLSKVSIAENIFSKKYSFKKRLLASRAYDAIILLSDGSIPLLLSRKLFIHIQQPLKQFEKESVKDIIKLKKVTAFFCNSEYTKSFLNSRFGIKTMVIYPPVETKPIDKKKENIILHVGRFRVKNVSSKDYKKQGFMVDVFKQLVDEGLKDWKFVIATGVKEEDKKSFEQLQKEAYGYPIEFHVNVSNDDLWERYSAAKIYWHASGFGEDLKQHPEFAEHFGISTVEAMSAGAVPVVINAGGQTEIVHDEENGLLWNTAEELKDQTLKLIHNNELWEKLSKNTKQKSAVYSKEAFCKNIHNLLDK